MTWFFNCSGYVERNTVISQIYINARNKQRVMDSLILINDSETLAIVH